MSKIYCVVYLSTFVFGNVLVQNIEHKTVEKVANIFTEDKFVFLNNPVQSVRENLSLQWQPQEKLNEHVFENTSITKIELAIDSSKVKVPTTSVIHNSTKQYINAVDFELSQIALDDDVEMDETIYLTFSEKDRRDGYKKTRAEENPYAVIVYVKYLYESDGGLCSGSLLTSSWVLTAAHCFDMDVDNVYVCAGANSIQDIKESKEQVQIRTSNSYHKHPSYSAITKPEVDIALVRVDEPFKMTKFVKTVQLRKSRWTRHGYKACMLTGFGSLYLKKQDEEDQTRKTHYLEVKNTCPCLNQIRYDVLMCSRPREDYGLCTGDSGGGLICDGKIVAIACAIVSFKDISNCVPIDSDCGRNNTLSVFVKTGSYLEWMNSMINRASTDRLCYQIVIGVLVHVCIFYQSTL